jgi:hypothetical protein
MDYSNYYLVENPFPEGGILQPYSSNSKINGEIFCVEARKDTINSFEQRFICAPHFSERKKAGFLWAESTIDFGRGMGKTALLIYFKHKINKNWGRDYTQDDSKKLCAIYVSFSQEIKDYQLEHICLLALNACIEDRIFHEVKKTCDYNALINGGVEPNFATQIANGTVKDYLVGLWHKPELMPPRLPRDTFLLNRTVDLFLNQTIRALKVAGFIGGLLFIDDIENFVDLPGQKHNIIFAKNFGASFLRGATTQARERFLSTTFTTHLNSAQKLTAAWQEAGLLSAYPLDPKGQASVEVPKPDEPASLEIVKAYMDHFRTQNIPTGTSPFHPFTEESVKKAVNMAKHHPRSFLHNLNLILENALATNQQIIDEKFVEDNWIIKPKKAEVPKIDQI